MTVDLGRSPKLFAGVLDEAEPREGARCRRTDSDVATCGVRVNKLISC
jgi:hypothetical protein